MSGRDASDACRGRWMPVEWLTSWMASPEAWIALATLTGLEIVLGIDNIVFISILSGKLPQHQQRTARQGGLALALISRILLLFSISWIVTLTEPLFPGSAFTLSGKDVI